MSVAPAILGAARLGPALPGMLCGVGATLVVWCAA